MTSANTRSESPVLHPTARRLVLWIPAAAWAFLIFTLSSRSHVPSVIPDISDKVLHFIAFGVLSTLAYLGSSEGFVRSDIRAAAIAAAAATIYGALDEFHQAFVPGRHSDVSDLAADFAGAAVAAAAIHFAVAWHRRVFASPIR